MQLLDLVPNYLPADADNRLLVSLQDIADNIQIQPNFCISHPAFKPLQLTPEGVQRFQHLSVELQHKYLSLQLRSFLYGIYYNGYLQDVLALETETADKFVPPNLENNTFLGIDMVFYDRLHQSNCGQGYFDPGWQVLRQESDRSLAVTKGELTVHIDRVRHLKLVEQSACVGDLVSILMPRNLVQIGFYVAISDTGAEYRSNSYSRPTIVRIYFHFSSEGAVAVMANLTQQLNKIKIPFSFKVLYNPADYKRYDSGVLYFERSHYPVLREVLQKVYAENQAHFQPQIPLFTKQLAPGLALAEEPNRKFTAQESFGMNRCQIVADALLEAWHKGDNSSESRMNNIFKHFSVLGIDWQRPYLNANSEDIYTPLD
jgi:hypothetical protein